MRAPRSSSFFPGGCRCEPLVVLVVLFLSNVHICSSVHMCHASTFLHIHILVHTCLSFATRARRCARARAPVSSSVLSLPLCLSGADVRSIIRLFPEHSLPRIPTLRSLCPCGMWFQRLHYSRVSVVVVRREGAQVVPCALCICLWSRLCLTPSMRVAPVFWVFADRSYRA